MNAELLKEGILSLKKQGSCVIFSSHNMEHVEKICDHLVMLNNGKSVLNGVVHEIRESFGRTKVFLESPITRDEIALLDGVTDVREREDQTLEITLSNPEVGKEIFRLATADGYIPMFNQQPPTLEEIFKQKVGEANV